jgi:hypothetical protein
LESAGKVKAQIGEDCGVTGSFERVRSLASLPRVLKLFLCMEALKKAKERKGNTNNITVFLSWAVSLKCCIDILILCTVRNDAKSYQIS